MPTGILKKNEIVSLDIEQVASVCCVSVARVDRWIDVRGLRVSGQGECRNILSSDLVDFLVQYNMPIPEIILPAQAKKILFVFKNETLEFIYVKFLIKFFQKLKTEANFICDYISYGKDAEYKLMTFHPDLLVTDTISAYQEAIHLNKYFKRMGRNKILSIIDKGMESKDIKKINSSGADAVATRGIDINELVEQVNVLFQ
ncbi:MAG: hypothetical protein KKB91_09630 [Proteobacteria bacterium]|jgi:hypothetical protein|nr:hypothetical protein [Desulfocapsa sp.]MBU3944260.1 hypothetical protein [Pseudomonadota bacterium]MCG2745265.1 hypothetical protein [Desulfobacteraceae bacterium]MDO8948775.1 hypothetical protein [Desulfocapsaceae bacterium]MBU4028232.1 hypothetical protein [Pseudomonadota bacterium]